MKTGNDSWAARLEQDLSQRELARRSGLHRKAVQYWEAKPVLDPKGCALARMASVLNRRIIAPLRKRARGGVLRESGRLGTVPFLSNPKQKLATPLELERVICGAKTRSGAPCRAKSEPGRKRCRFHGGLSTGPKTIEGRERIAEAQRQRWADA